MTPDRLHLVASGCEAYIDTDTGSAVICDAVGGAMPLDPQESAALRDWLSAKLDLGASRQTWVWKSKPRVPDVYSSLDFEVGDEHAVIAIAGERWHLDHDEQQGLVKFVLEHLAPGWLSREIALAVDAEIERRAEKAEEA